jgi:hypothetical protein
MNSFKLLIISYLMIKTFDYLILFGSAMVRITEAFGENRRLPWTNKKHNLYHKRLCQ